jgi:hypothetical protein
VIATILLLGSPVGWSLPRPDWTATERAGWIAGILSAALSLVSTVAAVATLRESRNERIDVPRGLLRIGVVPQQAAWFQDRLSGTGIETYARKRTRATSALVLCGMGGTGKTQLAAQLTRRIVAAGNIDLLVWVTASSRDAIAAAYAEAARALRIADASVKTEAAAGRLLGWLEGSGRRWLIVLDNLDAPADVAGWWPPTCVTGCTIVTTRRRDAALSTDGRSLVPVELFTPDESVDYLTRALGPSVDIDRDEARLIAADLGHLPLAVAQAAAFIRDRNMTLATYREQLADRTRALAHLLPHDDALPDDHRGPVHAAWSLSREAANAARPRGLAIPLLEFVSVLDPNVIPVELLKTKAASFYLCGDAEPARFEKIDEALHNLHRFSLITYQKATLRIHSLVQRAARDEFTPEGLAFTAKAAGDAMLEIWPETRRDTTLNQVLRANAAALTERAGATLLTPGVHPVHFCLIEGLGVSGLMRAAADTAESLVTACTTALGPDHVDTLNARYHKIIWLGNAGEPGKAAEEAQALVSACRQALEPDHPLTLSAEHESVRWLGHIGDPVGAVTASAALFADRRRVLGPDHPDTLITQAYLAYWRGQAGDIVGAIEACRELLAANVRLQGVDHPDTLNTRHNLARWQGHAGDAVGAVAGLQAVLVEYRRTHGDSHPRTLGTAHELARWRAETGNVPEAISSLTQVLAGRLRALGPEHRETLTTRHELARVESLRGNFATAVAALTEVLADRTRLLGPSHPETLATRHELGRCRAELGEVGAAVTALEKVLADRTRVLGQEHPDTHRTRVELRRLSDTP